MPATTKRTFSLPDEQSQYIDRLVASGTYATGSEVVRAGLRALQERDAAVETWLRDEVVKTYDAMMSDPSPGRSPDDVRAGLRARHSARLRGAVSTPITARAAADGDTQAGCNSISAELSDRLQIIPPATSS